MSFLPPDYSARLNKAKKTPAPNAQTGVSAQSFELEPQKNRGPKGFARLSSQQSHLQPLSLKRATQFSLLLHVLGPFVLALAALTVLMLFAWLLHFNFWDWFQSKSPPKDIEFTLVKDTQALKPEKPLFKGSFNQQAGGKQNHHQPLKPTEDAPAASASHKQPPPQPAKQPSSSPTPQPKAPPPQPKLAAKSLPPAWIPTKAKAMPNKSLKNNNTVQPTTQTNSESSPVSTVTPALESSSGTPSAVTGAGNPLMSNPQDGQGPTPGVDVAQDADFGPFMADLEKRIKRNWVPPRDSQSRKVVLLFYLSRDGHVVKIEVKKTSGDIETDESATQAVQASAPFMAFPPQVKEDILPVEFTFDYNVLNPKNPKQALKW